MAQSHKNNSDLVKDIIIRVSDGLTVPFALTSGMSGVLSTNHLVIVSGIAEIAAGCKEVANQISKNKDNRVDFMMK